MVFQKNNIEFKTKQKIYISNLDVLGECIKNEVDLNDLIDKGKIKESYKYHSLQEFFYYISKVDTENEKVKFMVIWNAKNITYSSTLNQYFFTNNQYVEINDNYIGEYIKILRLDYSKNSSIKEYFYKKN